MLALVRSQLPRQYGPESLLDHGNGDASYGPLYGPSAVEGDVVVC
jgi:hypothetical protein